MSQIFHSFTFITCVLFFEDRYQGFAFDLHFLDVLESKIWIF